MHGNINLFRYNSWHVGNQCLTPDNIKLSLESLTSSTTNNLPRYIASYATFWAFMFLTSFPYCYSWEPADSVIICRLLTILWPCSDIPEYHNPFQQQLLPNLSVMIRYIYPTSSLMGTRSINNILPNIVGTFLLNLSYIPRGFTLLLD
jgi:hypothetical protein